LASQSPYEPRAHKGTVMCCPTTVYAESVFTSQMENNQRQRQGHCRQDDVRVSLHLPLTTTGCGSIPGTG